VAASQEQKVDFLLKKIGYVSSKTGIAEDSTLSGTVKAPFAEPIPSPLVIPSGSVWSDSSLIPATPPGSSNGTVQVYATASAKQLTVDSTVSGNRTFLARATPGNNSTSMEGNWIDPSFGADYVIKVFKGDPNSGGVQLSAAGAGSNDTWFFDYSSGVLNFNGTIVPSGVTATNIYLVGYRYIGGTGIQPASGIGTFQNINVLGIATVGTTLDVNGTLDVDGSTTLDNVRIDGNTVDTTTGELILDSSTNQITVNADVNVAGILTAQNITVSGNLTVEGTTTTLDTVLTEVDKLEIGANNTTVGAAITQSGTGDILNLYDGSTEVFSVEDGGRIVGTATSSVIPFLHPTLASLPSASTYHGAFAHVHSEGKGYFAHGGNWFELVNKELNGITGTGTERYNIGILTATNVKFTGITTVGRLDIENLLVTGISTLGSSNGIGTVTVGTGGTALHVDGDARIVGKTFIGDGTITIDPDNDLIDINGSQIQRDASGDLMVMATGGSNYSKLRASDILIDANVVISNDRNITAVGATFTDNVNLGDDDKLQIGAGTDLRLYHNGTNSYIENYTGNLYIFNASNDRDIHLSTDDGSGGTADYVHCDGSTGAVVLSHYGNTKLATTATGIEVTGTTDTDNLIVSGTAYLNGTVSAGSSTGNDGQYLISTGVGVSWTTLPTARTTTTITAAEDQTSFAFNYNVGFVDVFYNGVKLANTEFTASNGTAVVLNDVAYAGDIVELVSYNTASTGGGGGGASNLNDLADVTITGSPVIGETLTHNGTKFVNDYTATTTTTATTQVSILSLDLSVYRSVEYQIQVTEGSKYHTTKILAIHNGTAASHNEYGTLNIGASTATFDVDISGSNLRLLATPASSNSTVFKVKFTGIKV
jgi:hypothetical protein